MANPRKEPFYAQERKSEYSVPGQEWLEAYDNSCRSLVNYLLENGARSTLYYGTLRCLEELRRYLVMNDSKFSIEAATQWLGQSDDYPCGYGTAILRLNDFWEYGEIQPKHEYTLHWYSFLQNSWKHEEDDYLASLGENIKWWTLARNKDSITRFLYKMQSRGVLSPADLTFNNLEEFIVHDFRGLKNVEKNGARLIARFLMFMGDKGICGQELGWYFSFRANGHILQLKDLTAKQLATVESLKGNNQCIPFREFEKFIPEFLENYANIGYSSVCYKVARYTLYNLMVFLKMYDLDYHPAIATVWLEHNENFNQKRRIIKLFELYTKEGEVLADAIFRDKPFLCDALPLWCREAVDSFMALKEKEGWEYSTLCMYRNSVTRFCSFIVDQGVTALEDITPALIKKFNLADPHMTSEGKNAYNVRIRSFLRYLARQAVLPYGIEKALCCTAKTQTRIVKTLTEEEKVEIERKTRGAITSIEQRDRAIVLLGWRVGLRPRDIVQLKLTDINWDRQTIRFIQQKTKREIVLPMPTDVGNAIYLYLIKGRPVSNCPFIFLKVRAPYDGISRCACQNALKRILADLKSTVPEFRTLRKTFATDCLQDDVKPSIIADMLGHKGLTAIDHYLNLDTERMVQCPLSMLEIGVTLENEDRYE